MTLIQLLGKATLIISMLMNVGSNDQQSVGSLEKDGITLSWTYDQNCIDFSVTAETEGWIAVGFTNGKTIVGTNLIQGAVVAGEVTIEDQYVTSMGVHPRVEKLGGTSQVSQISGLEQGGKTTLRFSLPATRKDLFHFDLSPGTEINIWLAFSISDDFSHHSRKRFLRAVTL